MDIYLQTNKGVFRLIELENSESVLRINYLSKINKLNILTACDLQEITSLTYDPPRTIYSIFNSWCPHNPLTIDETLLGCHVELLLEPLYQKIFNFLLCCKKTKYFPKDVYKIILKKVYSLRYEY